MMRRIKHESAFVPGEFVLECGHWFKCAHMQQAEQIRAMTHVRCPACEPRPVQLSLLPMTEAESYERKREDYRARRRAVTEANGRTE